MYLEPHDFIRGSSQGTIVAVGSLCMDGMSVAVPQNPVWNGDIPDYIPGARLTLRPDAGYPKYQVRAIKVGNILIADRCLLKRISWEDCQMATEGKFIASVIPDSPTEKIAQN